MTPRALQPRQSPHQLTRQPPRSIGEFSNGSKITKTTQDKRTDLVKKRRNGLLEVVIPAWSEHMSIAKRNSVESPLLQLPAEIRNQIWQYTVGHQRIKIGWDCVPQNFSLPRVCRQLYVEASAFIYTLNTFAFSCPSTVDSWISKRVLGQRHLITSMDMPRTYMHSICRGTRKTISEQFPHIKRIGVDETEANFGLAMPDAEVEAYKKSIKAFIKHFEAADIQIDWVPQGELLRKA